MIRVQINRWLTENAALAVKGLSKCCSPFRLLPGRLHPVSAQDWLLVMSLTFTSICPTSDQLRGDVGNVLTVKWRYIKV